MSSSPPALIGSWLPWRSAAVGWTVAVALVVAGVPPFLRMPPWCDITLYDVATRTVLDGGMHYRDIFDTNLPGFIWLLCVIRSVFGWSTEVLRAADLLIVGSAVYLLAKLARSGGATPSSVAWMVAGTAGFYLYASEMCHAQRDVWMVLPVAAAVTLRLSRLGLEPGNRFRSAVAEGALWGAAVWLKPHVVVIAAVMWLVTARRVAAGSRRAAGADLLGCVVGGAGVGLLGVSWMVATGTWAAFVEVFGTWNPYYVAKTGEELDLRLAAEFSYFPMWSQMNALGLILAVLAVLDGRLFSRAGTEAPGPVGQFTHGWVFSSADTDDERYRRAVLAMLYLSWAVQAAVTQRGYHYVHVPEMLLMFAVVASVRWAAPAFFLGWMVANSLVYLATDTPFPGTGRLGVPRDGKILRADFYIGHPALDPERARWWAACFRAGLPTPEYMARRDAVGFDKDFTAGIAWEELAECAEFLKTVQPPLRDGELMCWHDTPHALYLMLGVKPAFRFMHVTTISSLDDQTFLWLQAEAKEASGKARYAVSDLERVGHLYPRDQKALLWKSGPDLFPPRLPQEARKVFPMDQPAVFRSRNGTGRYIVHRVTHPSEHFNIP